MAHHITHLRIFADGPHGGNPLPVVISAAGMTDLMQQNVAATTGHESGFVFPGPPGSGCDFEFRFWVPEHEMEMCGHATVGAVWLLERLGKLPRGRNGVRIWTKSGVVDAKVTRREVNGEGVVWVEISQGKGMVEGVKDEGEGKEGSVIEKEICEILGIELGDLMPGYSIQNARTSRTKTMIPLQSVDLLNNLNPKFDRIKDLCERIGSTGLYPYAVVPGEGSQVFSARQFPKNSGYKEDAATGIAASALAFALLENGLVDKDGEVVVKQGIAMGAPSKISIRFRRRESGEVEGCWIGGTAEYIEEGE